jgi:C4-dicarboxylate-specific signal transduction histidine kinase
MDRDTLVSSPVAKIFTEETRRAFVGGLFDLMRGGNGISSEGRLIRPEKTDLPIVINLWHTSGETSGVPDQVFIGLTNMSGKVTGDEAKEDIHTKLAHAARIAVLGEMTASITHEVNQPLGTIVTSAEAGLRWLDREEPDLGEVRELLMRIVLNGKRAANIVTAMHSMAHKKKTERRKLVLKDIVDEAVLILRSDLAKRQIGLQLDLAPELPCVMVDQTQILQVIVNLALNAAQAMADGQAWNRTLAIRTKLASGAVAVEVEDSGPGVDPNVRDKLFESFYTTKDSGIGMGLAICRSIIESHGSEIELESSPYLGARFTFSLPVAVLP